MAVTDMRRLLALLLIGWLPLGHAAILPEDRADALYHLYDGDGLTVQGPSVLVRKGFKDKVSVWGNHYVDHITSASVDVRSNASEYAEQRDQYSLGVDYLRGKTFMGVSYTNSEETDYSANNVTFGISQDLFGDLTTLGISYSRGWDEVRRNGDDNFAEDTERQGFRVDLSQILTKNLILNLNYEGITDEGFLNNPYRQVRFLNPDSARGFDWQPEVYPRTKTSSASAVRALYYLPYRASLKGEYRWYSDTWGVQAWNIELGYVHPLPKGLTLDVKYRYYDQTAADFYSDLFDRRDQQNFLARDKELSTMTSQTIGAGVSYEFDASFMPGIDRGELNLFVDYILFDYADFRDVSADPTLAPGEEPFFSFESTVVRAYLSFWF